MASNRNIQILNFANQNIPVPYQPTNVGEDSYVPYGYDNLYPHYLLNLYANSPIHSSLINGKSTYIMGNGISFAGSKDAKKVMVNPEDSLAEFASKCVLDYLIFNYFAVEVIFNKFSQPIEYHWVPAHTIRTNKSKTKFWYSEDWTIKKKLIKYERFSPYAKGTESKIFFFDGYFPSYNQTYSQPEYNGSIKSISTDIAIRDFNLNNIKNQFSVSTLITFFNGSNIPDEVKQQVISDLNKTYSGENGKKLIVDFQAANGKSADVRNLSVGDWDKAYTLVAQSVKDDIFIGHSVPSPALFGVKTEGQLGSTQELETAYEIFQNKYIRVKRNELIGGFNALFTNSTLVTGSIEFLDKPLFNTQLSETVKEKIYTINELRKLEGLPELPSGNRLLSESPVIAPSEPQISLEKEEKGKRLTEEDYEQIKHLGNEKSEFEIVNEKFHFSKQSEISSYLIDNNVQDIAIDKLISDLSGKGIEVGKNELKGILSDLNEAGIVRVQVERDNVKISTPVANKVPSGTGTFIMYDYVKRPEMKGGELLPTSRGFCVKLVQSNKYYSREDIQTMASIFGYDIFSYGGGFYHNPDTGETTSHCRHYFKPIILKRKGGNQ